jgi:hypothetical protein
MVDWMEIGERWAAIAKGLAHGETRQRLMDFAREEELAPGTVRECATAVEFADKLIKDGIISSRAALKPVSRKTMGTLRSLSYIDMDTMRPVLDRALRAPIPSKKEVVALARTVSEGRHQKLKTVGSRNANVFRSTSPAERRMAVDALGSQEGANGSQLARPSRNLFGSVQVDLVINRQNGTRLGVRALGSAAPTTRHPRTLEAFIHALAAARVFDEVTLIALDDGDAHELARRVEEVGPCGVGVVHYDVQKKKLTISAKAKRSRRPDLAALYSDKIQSLFPSTTSAPKA